MSVGTASHQAFHRGTAAIFAILTPDQIQQLADLRGDEATSQRLQQLAKLANEGELSAADQDEYEAYIEANNILAVLQAEARFHLADRGQ